MTISAARKAFLLFSFAGFAVSVFFMGLNNGIAHGSGGGSYEFPLAKPEEGSSVMDYSRVFTPETDKLLSIINNGLQDATGAEIFTAAFPAPPATGEDGYADLDRMADSLFNRLGLGSRAKDNGVLILFTTAEPHMVLRTGSGAEACITDAEAGRILDANAVTEGRAGKWNLAARKTALQVAVRMYACEGKTFDPPAVVPEEVAEVPRENQVTELGPEFRLDLKNPPHSGEAAGTESSPDSGNSEDLPELAATVFFFIFLAALAEGIPGAGGGSISSGGSGSYRRSSSGGRSHGGGHTRGGGARR
ncbi:TPM domain-containing protein [Succinimonas amylolytica]|uniref:TPM domain-containing protein n=1 Tax=Succinimonas amylolytica TaxID=83769 RepID=UPI000371153D|nr:TPM domain-containing protein [Succinimonas amylolytica]